MNLPYTLNYQVLPTPQGVVLHIWETLEEHDEARIRRGSPFLFRINFRLPGIDEAYHVLQNYLELLGGSELNNVVMDETRTIIICPTPTEEFMP